ncbi:MAG TPA: lytic transglycosylase domain-containing protein [Symbiobacteriaceae bacterium]
MLRGWKRTTRLVLWLALACTVALVGGRWLLVQVYPLEYENIIFQAAREYGLDPFLVAAVIRTESRFRPGATSPQGARGLMQIMPETGRWAAAQMQIPYSEELLYDPHYNIRMGCWYLAELHREFGGDTVLALAAYNGGRTNVARWLQMRQWTGEHRTLQQIPFPETRRYVALVLRDHRVYRFIYGSLAREEVAYATAGALE